MQTNSQWYIVTPISSAVLDIYKDQILHVCAFYRLGGDWIYVLIPVLLSQEGVLCPRVLLACFVLYQISISISGMEESLLVLNFTPTLRQIVCKKLKSV